MSSDDPLAVVHLLWSGEVGGIERVTTDLAAEQISHGLHVGIAFGVAQGPFVQVARELTAEVSDLGLVAGYDVRPWHIARCARLLARADVVHLHAYNPALERLCSRVGRPIVFTEHGNFGQGRRVGVGHKVKEQLKARFIRQKVSVIAANSAYTAATLANTYHVAEESIHVVHNGIPLRPAERGGEAARSRENVLRVAFVGRLAGFKQVDRVIDAVAQMAQPRRVSVVIAGTGPLEDELRLRAAAVDVEDCVAFVGYRDNVASLLEAADVQVQSSRGEPFGLAVVEGCAAGALPVAFADGGGVLETMPPDGIVVRDVKELASVFDELRGSPAISNEARLARAEWARERFPISRMHDGYSDLYRLALKNRQR